MTYHVVIDGMERSKTQAVNVTLPINVIEEGKAAVARGEARSFSAWLSSRLRRGEATDQLQVIVDDIESANVDMDPAEQERVKGETRRLLDAAFARWDSRHGTGADAA
jgi:hypothetical protein